MVFYVQLQDKKAVDYSFFAIIEIGRTRTRRNFKGILFLILAITLNIVTLLQSALPGNVSSLESGRMTALFVRFSNLFSNATTQLIMPEDLELEVPDSLVQGESRRLNFRFEPDNVTNQGLRWTSSDPATIEITSGGIMVAKGELNAPVIIRATSLEDPSIYDEVTAVIKENPVPEYFEISATKPKQKVGLTSRIIINSVEPRFGDASLIKYKTVQDYGSVDQNGIVRSNKPGLVEVIAYSDLFAASTKINFIAHDTQIIPPTSLNISGSNRGGIYEYVSLNADFGSNIPSDTAITWSSQDPYIGDVVFQKSEEDVPLARDGQQVYIYGRKFAGETIIKATSDYDPSIFSEFKINFHEILPTEIAIKTNETIISLQQPYPISADFSPFNVTSKEAIFASSDESIAIVENKGDYARVRGLKPGVVTITVHSLVEPHIKGEMTFTITALSNEAIGDVHAFLRKAVGHFSLYLLNAVFGLLAILYFFNLKEPQTALIVSGGFGMFFSFISEFIQSFVAGRAGLILDGIINLTGYLAGIALFFFVRWLYLLYQRRKKATINE